MRKIAVILIMVFVVFAIEKNSPPYTFSPQTPARSSEVNANFDSLDSKIDQLVDTVNSIREITAVDTLQADSAYIWELVFDSAFGDTIYSTALRTQRFYFDSAFGDTIYSTALKARRSYFDTIYNTVIWHADQDFGAKLVEGSNFFLQQAFIDTLNSSVGNITISIDVAERAAITGAVVTDTIMAINYTGGLRLMDDEGNLGVHVVDGGDSVFFSAKIETRVENNGYIRLSSATNILADLVKNGANDDGLLQLFSSGVTNIQLHSNGASYLNGGNLGIGTSTPTEGKLQIPDAGSTTPNIILGEVANGSMSLYSYQTGHTYNEIEAGTNEDFIITTNGTGLVGINTTSPASLLHVNGGVTIEDSIKVNGDVIVNGIITIDSVSQTLSTNTITISSSSKSTIRIDTEGGAAVDTLETISGGNEGDIIIIKTTVSFRQVFVDNEEDNIYIGSDVLLDSNYDRIVLQKDSGDWVALSVQSN
jgi:hypothetical protein